MITRRQSTLNQPQNCPTIGVHLFVKHYKNLWNSLYAMREYSFQGFRSFPGALSFPILICMSKWGNVEL